MEAADHIVRDRRWFFIGRRNGGGRGGRLFFDDELSAEILDDAQCQSRRIVFFVFGLFKEGHVTRSIKPNFDAMFRSRYA